MTAAPRPGHRVTIGEVAKHAGVSVATVSFVVNDKPGVKITEATRARVRASVQALGYRPNALAKNLSLGGSRFIGVVADAIATTPFAGQVIQGAQDEAWRNGYVLLVANTDGDRAVETEALGMLLEHQVAGILYSTWFHHEVEPPAALRAVPHVLVNCYSSDPDEPAVVSDEVQGGRAATEVLLEAGHRRIAFLNATEDTPGPVGRLEGYRQALAAHDVELDPRLVLAIGHDQESGYDGLTWLLGLDPRPTAVFCYNDRVAMGLYDGLRERGLRVPEDLAVVGFDNQEIIAGHLRPPLTSVALPHYEIGARAIEVLLGQRDDEGPRHLVACPTVTRGSA